ncbi:MAG: HEAT repeat domain-containing protein [candidate division Zixibacteria bacterium]|nr:HEAT repeat domain-containing protein [candidate division Zixibacteria bacterium]
MSKVIATNLVLAILLVAMIAPEAAAKSDFDRTLDSLFVVASSMEIMYQNMRDSAMNQIASYGVNAVPYLIEKFTTESSWDRWTVIWIFQRIGSPAVPLLLEALKRPDELVVQRVAWALGDIKDSSAVDGLIGVCHHSCWQVRDEAVGSLGRIGSARASEAVREALRDTIGQVRKSAVVSCGQLRVKDAAGELVHALGDEFYGARLTAVNSLLQLDTVAVMTVLTDSLASTNAAVGHMICQVLGRIVNEESLMLLGGQLDSSDPARRTHAALALTQVDPKDECGFLKKFLESETDRLARLKIESALNSN